MSNKDKSIPHVTKLDIKGERWKFLSRKEDKGARPALPIKYSVGENTSMADGSVYSVRFALDAKGQVWKNNLASSDIDMDEKKQFKHLRLRGPLMDEDFLSKVARRAPKDYEHVVRMMARLRGKAE